MSEPTTEPTPAQAPPAAAPPWGDDFDPARAWHTIQTLREAERERNTLRGQVEQLKPQADQFRALEEASKSEAQRLAEQADTARRDAESARAEAVRYKAAATHRIPVDHFDLLGSGTEDEILARAEKLAGLLAAQATTVAPQGRPVEQLKPGASPSEALNEDDALYAQLFPDQ
jgi:predicted phage gp36 major capsid-like protein